MRLYQGLSPARLGIGVLLDEGHDWRVRSANARGVGFAQRPDLASLHDLNAVKGSQLEIISLKLLC
jgi:hypothetical protein